jgi:hypothetical protein
MKTKRTPKSRIVALFVISACFIALILWGIDRRWRATKTVYCDDGKRETIDMRDFENVNFAYSVQIEATLTSSKKLSGKLSPVTIQQFSESLQLAREFQKSLVAGYNACAVSKSQYSDAITRFRSLDGLAQRIDQLSKKDGLRAEEINQLSSLVGRYIELSNGLNQQ